MKYLVPSLLLTLALAFEPPDASCRTLCSCGWERDPLKARDAAAVVVAGLALDSTLSRPPVRYPNHLGWYEVRVVVEKVWKGTVPDTITVRTTDSGGGCGFGFLAGQQYLLFLYRDRSQGLVATRCSISQTLDRADSVVKALGPPLR